MHLRILPRVIACIPRMENRYRLVELLPKTVGLVHQYIAGTYLQTCYIFGKLLYLNLIFICTIKAA